MADREFVNVLAIDGGGIRGIIPAIILAELERRMGRRLHEAFDLVAGTSTGGIIALGICTPCNGGKPYSPADLLELYRDHGREIFRRGPFTALASLVAPKYSARPLNALLNEYFGDTMLKSSLTDLLIASYDLQAQSPFFFKSHRARSNPDYDWKISLVARATSAAPTFFPPLRLRAEEEEYALVDGGVFANNPAMAAYAEARSLHGDRVRVRVVSVGTGDRRDNIGYASARRWGLLSWARQIVPVFMDSVSEGVDYEISQLPGCVFHRLQLPLLPPIDNDMDDASTANVAALEKAAEIYVRENAGLMESIARELG
jgi:patatin-like phospholipase/acyl hydrolase